MRAETSVAKTSWLARSARGLGIAMVLALAPQAQAQGAVSRPLDLRAAWQQSDVVVVAQVLDRTETTELTVRAANGRPVEPFRRLIRLYQRVETLRGSAPTLLRVDEARWRVRWQAAQRCGGRSDCPEVAADRYIGDIHREPVPGDRVLLFLRKTRDGLEWTADFSVDKAVRAEEVRHFRVRPDGKTSGVVR